jgi:tetratricopeptide (TPR) repeat protein
VVPNQADSLHLKGLIAFRRNKVEEAAALMERAMAGGPPKGAHLRNISEVYRLLGRLDEAVLAARRGAAMDPADPMGPFNLAMVEYDRMELDSCVASARRAVELRASLPQAHMKLGQALLARGDFAEGWEHYEWRYQIPGAAPLMPPTDRKQWDGRPLPNDHLLLIGDQGYGDVIMFGRYVAWVQSICPSITVACSPEMRGIIAQLAPGAHIAVRWEDCPPYIAYCPFSGLPRLASTTLETIPQSVPYLRADPGLVLSWRARLDEVLPAGLRRIAIAWAGRPTHNNDRNRSLTLQHLAPLAQIPGVAYVSLQKGPPAAQSKAWPGPAPLLDLDAAITSFEDSAAILQCVDELVSVDTSMVHLAGAMGRKVTVMMPFAPDWRWLTVREDTPWYPDMRLFRQPRPKDWDSVISRVVADLSG